MLITTFSLYITKQNQPKTHIIYENTIKCATHDIRALKLCVVWLIYIICVSFWSSHMMVLAAMSVGAMSVEVMCVCRLVGCGVVAVIAWKLYYIERTCGHVSHICARPLLL